MKILIIHNKYQQQGGEDKVAQIEFDLLKENSHEVEMLLFNNDKIKNTVYSKLSAAISGIYNIESLNKIKSKIKEFNPDIIHVHNFFPLVSPSVFFIAKKFGIPIVMTLHNYRLICPSALLLNDNKVCEKCIKKAFPFSGVMSGCYRGSKVQTFALAAITNFHKYINTWQNKIDRYIVLTKFAKSKFLESSLKIPTEKFDVKQNFVDDFGFEYEKDDYYLFVGRLSEEKGINVLLEAFKELDSKLIIIGQGEKEEIVKEYENKFTNISYIGFQQADIVMQKLKRAKALIFPSIWYEGLPMTILESFSSATAVISSNIGGPKEIVLNNINGLHFKVGSSKDLINKIMKLENDNNLLKTLCAGARETFEQKYTKEINYQKLIGIYKDVINKSHNEAYGQTCKA